MSRFPSARVGGCQDTVPMFGAGAARAAAALPADAAFACVLLAERAAVLPQVSPCRLGRFYLLELPPPRAVLDDPERAEPAGPTATPI